MPQTSIDVKSNSLYTTLITFIFGGFAVRYTSCPSAISFSDKVYAALPAIQIDLAKQSGQAKDEPIKITMPPLSPFDIMLQGGPHAPVIVLIQELDVLDVSTIRYVFKGFIAKVLSGKNGRDDVIEITVNGLRAALDIPLGIPANNTCAWTFGDFSCTKSLPALRVSTLVTAIVATQITIASVAHPKPYFDRGYVERNGLRIMVRNQIDASNLVLVNTPPANWLTSSVVITPGCNKSISDCRTKWSNEGQFGGLGLGIPRYHPVFETQ